MPSTRPDSPGYDLCRNSSFPSILPLHSTPTLILPCLGPGLILSRSTFVNGRSRDVIMVEMRQRFDRSDTDREIVEIIQVSVGEVSEMVTGLTRAGHVRYRQGPREKIAGAHIEDNKRRIRSHQIRQNRT